MICLSWLWFLLSATNIFPSLLLPPPQKIIEGFYQLFAQNALAYDLFFTLYRMIIGLLIGLFLGVSIGLAIGFWPSGKYALPWIDFLRSIPGAALFPIFMLFFGLGEAAKISLVIFASALIIAFNTVQGIKNINTTRLMVAKTLRLDKAKTLCSIILPEALPFISVGVRHAISYSLIMVIVSEMFIGAELGLGRRIVDFHLTYDTGKMYAVIILTGIIGHVLNHLYLFFESKKIHWVGK